MTTGSTAIMLTSHVGAGGDWVAIQGMARILRTSGHTVHLLGGGDLASVGPEFAVVHPVPLNQGGLGFLRTLPVIFRLPRATAVLHAHTPIALLLASLIRLLHCRQARVVFTYHWHTPGSRLRSWVKGCLFRLADCVHAYSTDVAKRLPTDFGLTHDRIELFYLSIDGKRFVPPVDSAERQALRKGFGIRDNCLVLGFAGRLNPEKRIHVILEFLAKRVNRGQSPAAPELVFLLAGDGPLRPQLQRRAEELGLGDSVRFLGRLPNPRDFYCSIDLLILPSNNLETFGLVVAEAAYCGTPTLRSNTHGSSDQIQHGVNGYVFDLEDPADFERQLSAALASAGDWPVFGRRANAHARAHFTERNLAAGLARLYGEGFAALARADNDPSLTAG